MAKQNFRLDVIVPVAISVIFPFVGLYAFSCIDDWRYPQRPFAIKPIKDESGNVIDFVVQSRNEYNQWMFSHCQSRFEWQARCAKLIFFMSVLVAITGIALAIWQFSEAARTRRQMEEVTQMDVKLGLGSLAFKSQSMATFMMFMSLAYLMIYVAYVYPFSVLPESQPVPVIVPDTSGTIEDSQQAYRIEGAIRRSVVCTTHEASQYLSGWMQ